MTSNDKKMNVPRHSVVVRICHWINAISFVFLLITGIHIFLDFPELYLGNVGYRGYPAIFRLTDFGITWEELDAIGDRRWGRNYHFLFIWVFSFNGLVYLIWGLKNKVVTIIVFVE